MKLKFHSNHFMSTLCDIDFYAEMDELKAHVYLKLIEASLSALIRFPMCKLPIP